MSTQPATAQKHMEMLDHPQNNSRSYRRYAECRRYVPDFECADRVDDVTCPKCRAALASRESVENCP